VAFTYEVTTLRDSSETGSLCRVRLLVTDTVNTDDQPAIFDDEEILAYLQLAGGNEYEAGAQLYECWARSRGRIAILMKTPSYTTQRQAISVLLGAAQNLRDAQFRILQTGDISSPSGMDYLNEFRPTWRDAFLVNQVVE
jgi:hypothetical protein